MKLKKGDKVAVIAGKDKGKDGLIDRVYKNTKKVMIMDINVYKKHIKKSKDMPKGGVVALPRPLDVSKVMFICPKCEKKARIGYKVENSKKKSCL
jgi:large subunit ribosomal protein L24